MNRTIFESHTIVEKDGSREKYMASQKVENILNLALDATQEERRRSMELDIGYNPAGRSWNLIIKYAGSLSRVRQVAEQVTELMNEYAIVTVEESRIPELSAIPQIEYIEKPKRLFFQIANGRRVSCIDEVQGSRFSLLGQGVLIGVIDSGIDYTLREFRNEDGTTRIRSIWDQSLRTDDGETAPQGYGIGIEYTKEQINEALAVQTEIQRTQIVRSRDTSGHGTAVAGIAASVAPASEFVIVKLGNPQRDGFPRTTELMLGIDYVIRKSQELQMPVAVNISFGNTYGSHEPYHKGMLLFS